MADKASWLYPYREDPQQTRLGQPVFRPFVPVSLATNDASTPELEGLVDTGADAILASDLLADELGLDLGENEGEELHAVGGRTITARYKTVSLSLHQHDARETLSCESPWLTLLDVPPTCGPRYRARAPAPLWRNSARVRSIGSSSGATSSGQGLSGCSSRVL